MSKNPRAESLLVLGVKEAVLGPDQAVVGAQDALFGLEQADPKPLQVPPCGLLTSPLDGTILLQGGHLGSLLQRQLVFAVQKSGNSFIMPVPSGNLIIKVVLRHFHYKLHFSWRVVAQQ